MVKINKTISIISPFSGENAKLCTETNTPERTKTIPKKDKINVDTLDIKKCLHEIPLLLTNFSICKEIVDAIHTIKDTFSTGSQNQNPPHPSSRYAHQLPNDIPTVSNAHGAIIQG